MRHEWFQVCTLTEFLLDTVSLETYSDTPSEHLPSLFLQIVTLLTDHCDMLSPTQTAKALQLCAKILTRVQPTIVAHSQAADVSLELAKVVSGLKISVWMFKWENFQLFSTSTSRYKF